MSTTKKTVKFKCPFCDKRYTREDLVIHVGDNHDDMIPEEFTALRLVFNYVNKKPMSYHGRCSECGGITDWDELKGRYNRQCNKPACKASYLKKFEDNMMRTKGVTRVSSTSEGLEKMLANRKISGTYKFQNGTEKTYTGKYELATLKFMDQVMNINPDDIMSPGPILEYEYNGKKHLYITDFLYIPYNLLIEVKDGGKRPNNREMPEYRAKQIAKEEFVIKNTNYNYLRLTDNDLSQLLSVFMDLKMQLVDQTNERVIHVNEAMNALMTGYIPGVESPGSTYIINYMQNNTFSQAISDNPKLTNLIIRNDNGELEKVDESFIKEKEYDVYLVDKDINEISYKLYPYIGKPVSEFFLMETVFDKKFYTFDQITFEESAVKVIDYYKGLEYFKEAAKNYFRGYNPIFANENSIMSIDCSDSDKSCVTYLSILNGNFKIESVDFPELYLESDTRIDKDKEKFLKMLSYQKGDY